MKTVRCLISIIGGLVIFSAGFLSSAYGYDYIYITNPNMKKIPLAIPKFQPVNNTPKATEYCIKSADLLESTLDFTSYFNILDRRSFLMDPNGQDLLPNRINYGNWRVVGADLLITGYIEYTDGALQMELRLFDTVKGENLISKRYAGTESQYRQMVRLFCSHIIQYLTNKEPIFNTKIAFVSRAGGRGGNKEIYTCDFDGYNVQEFTHNQSLSLFPAWSSDGQWLAYTSLKKNNWNLYIRHVKDNRGAVLSNEGMNSTPAWVPGRFELAATLSFSGDQEIYMLTGKGNIIKRLTYSNDIDTSPTFSPDGNRMAFVSKRSGSPQIHIMDLNSGESRRLTFSGSYNTQPDWSPEGDKICFSSMEGGGNDIMVINADGSGQKPLTRNAGSNESPSWSPDGSLIVFSSSRGGATKIYVMTAFGTDQRRLLDIPGDQSNPKWSPRINND
ncbi:MAG: Tol-Pal system beta propeller repeat protein TolB [Desulfobacteraceae bacterium]|nr:Tol-Pal system beta propeller repeat protein TolB [Desulfobacteraceae bacterium]